MGKLVVRRLLATVPILLIVSFGVTGLVVLIPGDAAVTLAGGENADPEKVQQIREQMHLDEPVLYQYGRWLWAALHGDFGTSIQAGGREVADELPTRILVTAQLILVTLVFITLAVFIVGLVGSIRPGSLADRGLLSLTNVAIAVPAFLVGILLIVIFSVKLRWFPPFGYVPFSDDPVEWLRRLIMPAAAVAAVPAAIVARQLHAGLNDTRGAPYVRTAWAKGGSTAQVTTRHVLRNAAMPAVTVLGLQIGTLLGSTVIVERIFNVPGVGSFLLDGIQHQDLPVIQAVTVFFVLGRMMVNLAVDISYGALDPRVRT